MADPARQHLLDKILSATTPEEIDAAWEAQRSWLAANPDDIGVLEAGEDLAYAEEALTAGVPAIPASPRRITREEHAVTLSQAHLDDDRVDDPSSKVTTLLRSWPLNDLVEAVVVSIDLVNSTQMVGSPDARARLWGDLRDLILELCHDEPIALQSWGGDGGSLICAPEMATRRLYTILDKLLALIPFVARSRRTPEFIRSTNLQVRIVCHIDKVFNTGDPATLDGQIFAILAHDEREIAIPGHVVTTDALYSILPSELQQRHSLRPNYVHPQIGTCWILDRGYTQAHLVMNTQDEANFLQWIVDGAATGAYDELDIFAYTNEGQNDYLASTAGKDIRIRVLMRSWVAESRDQEREITSRIVRGEQQITLGSQRDWYESGSIKSNADYIVNSTNLSAKIDMRFYEAKPLIKGGIFRSSTTGARTAYVGLYSFDPERPRGGTPYTVENWASILVSDDRGAGSYLIDSVSSRFREQWNTGMTYEQVLSEDRGGIKGYLRSAVQVWRMDGRVYTIVVVGRGEGAEGRIHPVVAAEDLEAITEIQEFLKRHQARFNLVVIPNDHEQAEAKWNDVMRTDGHIVVICRHSLNSNPTLLALMRASGFPYRFTRHQSVRLGGGVPRAIVDHLVRSRHGPIIERVESLTRFVSGMDREPKRLYDYCVVGSFDRPVGGKIFVIAGIHAMGTWGGAKYLVRDNVLVQIKAVMDSEQFSNFAAVVRVTASQPYVIDSYVAEAGPLAY